MINNIMTNKLSSWVSKVALTITGSILLFVEKVTTEHIVIKYNINQNVIPEEKESWFHTNKGMICLGFVLSLGLVQLYFLKRSFRNDNTHALPARLNAESLRNISSNSELGPRIRPGLETDLSRQRILDGIQEELGDTNVNKNKDPHRDFKSGDWDAIRMSFIGNNDIMNKYSNYLSSIFIKIITPDFKIDANSINETKLKIKEQILKVIDNPIEKDIDELTEEMLEIKNSITNNNFKNCLKRYHNLPEGRTLDEAKLCKMVYAAFSHYGWKSPNFNEQENIISR